MILHDRAFNMSLFPFCFWGLSEGVGGESDVLLDVCVYITEFSFVSNNAILSIVFGRENLLSTFLFFW